jgi:SM-20-related protein
MTDLSLNQSATVFVRHNFVDESTCAEWCAAVYAGRKVAATVANATGASVVDERARRTLCVSVQTSISREARSRLSDLLPELRRHFGISLSTVQDPQFLMYRRGNYFRPHQDNSTSKGHGLEVRLRRVSVVLFLNRGTQLPEPGTYCGGDLLLYAPRRDVRPYIQVGGQPGLLVAFLSNTFHEVRPITHGDRCTVVSWYAQGA